MECTSFSYNGHTCYKDCREVSCPGGYYEDKPDTTYFDYASVTVGSKTCYKASCKQNYGRMPNISISIEYDRTGKLLASYHDTECYELINVAVVQIDGGDCKNEVGGCSTAEVTIMGSNNRDMENVSLDGTLEMRIKFQAKVKYCQNTEGVEGNEMWFEMIDGNNNKIRMQKGEDMYDAFLTFKGDYSDCNNVYDVHNVTFDSIKNESTFDIYYDYETYYWQNR